MSPAGWEITPIPDDIYWNEWPEDLRYNAPTKRAFACPIS